MHIKFEILVHLRQQINENHINSVFLNENLFIFVLMSILHSYILDDNNEMIHRHKMSNLLNDWKFEFFLQFDLYILKRSLNFANEERVKVNKDTNKRYKFEYFKKDLVILESTFSINIKICSFLKYDIFLSTQQSRMTFFIKSFIIFLSYDVISEFFLSYLFYRDKTRSTKIQNKFCDYKERLEDWLISQN